MDFLKRMFALLFDEFKVSDEPAEEPIAKADEAAEKSDEPKVDAHGEIILNWDATSKKVDEYFETPTEKPEKKEEAPAEEEADVEEKDEAEEEDLEIEEADEKEEEKEVVEDEGEEETPVAKKRLADTQAAFRQERQKNKDLEKRLAALEEKATKPVPEKKDEKTELTLNSIDPQVLAKAMKENPVATLRWIADQQVKLSVADQKKADAQAQAVVAKESRIKVSEETAVKRFPIIQQVLDMEDKELEELKTKAPSKYVFAKKTAKYFKEFEARGDEEALYNAATRAYVELSPKMIKTIQDETEKLVKQELTNKKRVLGKVIVAKNNGQGGAGTSRAFKKLSDEEFMKLTSAQQSKYWEDSMDRNSATKNRR